MNKNINRLKARIGRMQLCILQYGLVLIAELAAGFQMIQFQGKCSHNAHQEEMRIGKLNFVVSFLFITFRPKFSGNTSYITM